MYRAATCVVLVRAFRGSSLLLRASTELIPHPDALDDQHTVLDLDVTLTFGSQPALARIDPARLQRASQCSGQSTGGCGDDVVEGGRVRCEDTRF